MRFFLLLLATFYCPYILGQIIIKGKIHNYDGKSEVNYCPTVEGIHTPVWEAVQPNSKGEFRIKYNNEGYGTTIISFDRLLYRFFHSEKSYIQFEIDQSKIHLPERIRKLNFLEERRKGNYIVLEAVLDSLKQEATLFIEGDYSDVNNFYNTNLRSSHSLLTVIGTYYSYLIRNAINGSEALKIIDSLTQIEFEQIKALGNIRSSEYEDFKYANREVKEFLYNEVQSFYSGVLLDGMLLKRRDQLDMLLWNPDTALSVYNTHWEKLVEYFFSELSNYISLSANSPDFNELVQIIRITKSDYQNYDARFQTKSNDEYIIESLLKPDSTILDAVLVLDEKSVLAHRIKALEKYFNSPTFYSPTLLYAYNQLKTKYPNSVHITQFEPMAAEVETYLKASAKKFDKAEIIETNYYEFEDLLELFKSKNLLIDIWASWCGPCIEEFNYKDFYKPFVDKGELTVLYMSIDKQRWEKKWRESIKYNKLEGYHVLANDVLIKDMWEFIGSGTGTIPRYVLIDENGEIFMNDSARPSQEEIFIEQINTLLSESKSSFEN